MRRFIRFTTLCIGFASVSLLSTAQPTANFSASITSGCSPIVVSFTDLSTGSPTSWSWDLGNGATSTLQNPSTTYTTPGTYTVKLTASNSSGSNTKTVTNYITVIASPTVAFTASDTTAQCPPFTESFTNSSTAGTGTASYNWDFGDGYGSTGTNPSHSYTTQGTYNVTLVVTNSSGCTKTLVKSSYIQMNSKPTANFSATTTSGCSTPLSINFTNSTTGGSTYLWYFGDGSTSTSTNPTHSYTSTGSYTVKLIATNSVGCKDSFTRSAYINIGTFTASFIKSSSTICAGSTISFTNTSTGSYTTNTWRFGDGASSTGSNPSHKYSTAGTYTVKLIINNGTCSDSTTQTITVNALPVVGFTGDTLSSCKAPQVVNFTNTSTGAISYSWDFDDGSTSTATNPSHTFSSLGSWTITLVATSSSGCKDSVKKSSYVNLAHLSGSITANPNGGCAPATISFTENVSASFSSYQWKFGDGSTSSSTLTPTHTYSAGTYTVKFIYTTTNGCTDTLSKTISVSSKPTAGFSTSTTSTCTGQTVNFTNTSSGATTYLWEFGDGNTSTSVNSSHTYDNADSFSVTLIAYNGGCADTIKKIKLEVIKGPYTHFTYSISCSNRKQVSFPNYSTTTKTSYSWDFGDGGSSTAFSPTHTYSSYGTYNVTLSVYDSVSGCTTPETRTVTIFPISSAFSVDDSFLCKNNTINYTGPSSSNYSSYNWFFGDGSNTVTGGNTVSRAYSDNGIYTVKLVVTDINGCTDTTTKTNYIHVGGADVKFGASPPNGCKYISINFTDSSRDVISITSRKWVFGDGTTITGNNKTPTHTYNSTGTYNVKLVVTDSLGCVDSLTKNNYINITKPTAQFSTTDTLSCPGVAVHFTNTSTNGVTWQWNFGDGNSDTAKNPAHSYLTGGYYTVSLIATNANGCKDTVTRTNYVHIVRLNLGFSMSDSFANCPPLYDAFTNTSSGITSYNWTFGNGGSSVLTNPSTIYTYPGTYTVWLRGQNSGGCMDSVSKTVNINGPRGNLHYSPTSGCSPVTISFTSTDTNATSITWDMNNGSTTTNSTSSSGTSTNTFSYTYTTAGAYVPVIVLTNASSCSTYLRGTDTIKVDKMLADFTKAPDSFCGSGTVFFSDTVLFSISGITSRSWNFGDGGTATGHNPAHNYLTSGTYTVKLIIGNATGCSDTVSKTVTIFSLPNVTAGPDKSFCQGGSTGLSVTGASTYSWSPSTGLSCTGCASPTASPTSTTTYVVTGTDAHGCSKTDTVLVKVNALPTIVAGADKSVCNGGSVTITATGGTSYTWSPISSLSCGNCANPTATPTTTTTYIVTGTDTNGCSNKDTIVVNINALPTVSAGSDKKVCRGSSANLTVTGAKTYTWTPTTGLSCSGCANPTASPTSTTNYVVSGTDSNGCTNKDTVQVVVNPLPNVSAGADKSICIGNTASLTATGALNYSWSPSTGLSCTLCSNPTVTTTTSTSYVVTGTDTNGCVNTDTVNVIVNPLPIVNAGPDKSVCNGNSAALSASGASTYVWTPTSGLSCTSCYNPTASPASTTSYIVTGTDAKGCVNTDTIIVTVKPLPVIIKSPDQSICQGKSVKIGASGAASYTWTPATGLSCTNCDSTIASPTNTTSYKVTGTGSNGCTDTAHVKVIVNPPPTITINHPDTTICGGQSLQLVASGASTYTWSPATGLSCISCSDPIADPSSAIKYTITGEDANGCTGTGSININVINKQGTAVGPTDTVCKGTAANLSATGGTEYIWSPSTGLDDVHKASPMAKPDTTTTYTVIIKQGYCFTDTNYETVFVYPVPQVTASGTQTILGGSSAQLYASGKNIITYEWSPADNLNCASCPSPVATPKKTTIYTVLVTGEGGCKDSAKVTVSVKCDNTQIFVPNTFTPNGDRLNDRFYPSGKGIGTVKKFTVFNRWGEIVFQASSMPLNDPSYGWDGTFNGTPVKPDVFVYILEAECESGEEINMKGDVSVVR
jgi:gliding motility-associated-like protein